MIPELGETLRLFNSKSRYTAHDVRQIFIDAGKLTENVTPNAMNNRMEQLRRSGLLDRVRDGRHWRYFKIKPSKE